MLKNERKVMRKIKRQQIKETVARVSPWDLCGSSSDIYKNLQDTESYYLKEDNTVIDLYWEWETGYYDDSGEFALVLTRLENDTEYNARVKKLMKIKEKEKSVKKQEEQKELQEYLRLKQKYEQ